LNAPEANVMNGGRGYPMLRDARSIVEWPSESMTDGSL